MSSRERTTSANTNRRTDEPAPAAHGGVQRRRSGFALAEDGSAIYYEVSGRQRPATTLVLCDGIGCDGYVWRYLQRVLGEEYRIIHLHYRGHGRTPAPEDPRAVTVPHLSGDVLAVLDTCE